MYTIWKYKLNNHGETQLSVPVSNLLLSVQWQEGGYVAWFLVDTEDEQEIPEWFYVFWTGEPIEYKYTAFWKYVTTIQSPTNGLVGHVFRYV